MAKKNATKGKVKPKVTAKAKPKAATKAKPKAKAKAKPRAAKPGPIAVPDKFR